jgi:hypothetical protein
MFVIRAVGISVWRASKANEVAATERVREQEVGCEQGARLRHERVRERAISEVRHERNEQGLA